MKRLGRILYRTGQYVAQKSNRRPRIRTGIRERPLQRQTRSKRRDGITRCSFKHGRRGEDCSSRLLQYNSSVRYTPPVGKIPIFPVCSAIPPRRKPKQPYPVRTGCSTPRPFAGLLEQIIRKLPRPGISRQPEILLRQIHYISQKTGTQPSRQESVTNYRAGLWKIRKL